VSLIAREPERYGFVVTPEDPLRYDVVRVPQSMPLKRIATLSGLPVEEIERLNPELRLKQTPPGGAYALKVPVGGGTPVQVALEREAAGRAVAAAARPRHAREAGATAARARPPAFHVVKARETVAAIARRYGVSADDIARWNGLDETALIRPGDRLRVASLARAEEEQGGFR
jgi:membrane-bound lytic murein transglycosylase D